MASCLDELGAFKDSWSGDGFTHHFFLIGPLFLHSPQPDLHEKAAGISCTPTRTPDVPKRGKKERWGTRNTLSPKMSFRNWTQFWPRMMEPPCDQEGQQGGWLKPGRPGRVARHPTPGPRAHTPGPTTAAHAQPAAAATCSPWPGSPAASCAPAGAARTAAGRRARCRPAATPRSCSCTPGAVAAPTCCRAPP